MRVLPALVALLAVAFLPAPADAGPEETAPRSLVRVHAVDRAGHAAIVSIDEPKVDVRTVLTALGESAGWSVVIGDGVEGRVSVFVREVPVSEALDVVLAQGGYAGSVNGTLVTVLR